MCVRVLALEWVLCVAGAIILLRLFLQKHAKTRARVWLGWFGLLPNPVKLSEALVPNADSEG